MARTWATVAMMAGGLGTLLGPSPAQAKSPDTVGTIVLHVTDFQRVPASELAEAEKATSDAYARIGVRMVWVEGAATTVETDGAIHLDIVILDRASTAAKGPAPATLGQANREARRAYIFYPHIILQARHTQSNAARVLGYVFAHEIGHIMLTERGHSPSGLMQAYCDGHVVNVPAFLPPQATVVRARVAEGR